jgi:cellulose synthase operon protein B
VASPFQIFANPDPRDEPCGPRDRTGFGVPSYVPPRLRVVSRLAVLLVSLVLALLLAGVFAGVAQAEEISAVDDAVQTTSTGGDVTAVEEGADAGTATDLESPPAEDSTSTDETAIGDEGASSETMPDATVDDAPADPTATDTTSADPPPETSDDATVESPPAETAPDPSENPTTPSTAPEPPAEIAPPSADSAEASAADAASPDSFVREDGGAWISPALGTPPLLPAPLLGLGSSILNPVDKGGSISGPPSADSKSSSRSSKTEAHRPSMSVGGGFAPSGGASAGAAPSAAGASGGGIGLAVEFVLLLLAGLSWALAVALTIPQSSTFALRSERPG